MAGQEDMDVQRDAGITGNSATGAHRDCGHPFLNRDDPSSRVIPGEIPPVVCEIPMASY